MFSQKKRCQSTHSAHRHPHHVATSPTEIVSSTCACAQQGLPVLLGKDEKREKKKEATPHTMSTMTHPTISTTVPAKRKLGEESCEWEPLSVWNQHAPRVYISVVLCFSHSDSQIESTSRHLKSCVTHLARKRPLFGAQLRIQGGQTQLWQSPSHRIPFETKVNLDESYAQQRAECFPPRHFVGPVIQTPGRLDAGAEPIPATTVRACFVKGGLFLTLNLHHSLCDGDAFRIFVECLAAETRGAELVRPSTQGFPRPAPPIKPLAASTFRGLVAKCPEYIMLPEKNGPTQPCHVDLGPSVESVPKTGKIFQFQTRRFEQLQSLVRALPDAAERPPPSKYDCLATLAFVHIVKARVEAEQLLPCSEEAALWNSVNFKKRFDSVSADYFGNATLPAVTSIAVADLLAAATDPARLAALVPRVHDSIAEVNRNYIYQRLAMLQACPDPRLVGVNFDPREPGYLAFNTWRHFGADVEWKITPSCRSEDGGGDAVSKPDAIRRGLGDWGLSNALILPARASAPHQELFVSLSEVAMAALCRDEQWLQWVDRIVD